MVFVDFLKVFKVLGKKLIKEIEALTWYHSDLVPQDSFDGKMYPVLWYQVFGRRRFQRFVDPAASLGMGPIPETFQFISNC